MAMECANKALETAFASLGTEGAAVESGSKLAANVVTHADTGF